MKTVGEFGTGWGEHGGRTLFKRSEEDLIGTARGHLMIPCFRPFDFLTAPNQPLTFLSGATSRVSVEALRGTQPCFHRNIDFDSLFFQWAGETHYETEFGLYSVKPATLTLIPGGIAHRARGSSDCLRMAVALSEPLEVLVGEDRHIGHTEYRVTWEGGPQWPLPQSAPPRSGRVLESLHTWEDEPGQETLIERDYGRLVGSAGEGRRVQNLRLFDIFTEITGVRGPGPVSMRNPRFFVECYNTTGAQFMFHRGNRSEEFQFQFCGTADNISEFGRDLMEPGDLAIVRRGISHRVIGSPNFRRFNLYSHDPWKLLIDPRAPARKTRFEVQETVIEAAPWRSGIKAP